MLQQAVEQAKCKQALKAKTIARATFQLRSSLRNAAMAPRAAVLLLTAAVAAAACAAASAQTRPGRLVVSGVVPCNTGTLIDAATSPAFPGTPASV